MEPKEAGVLVKEETEKPLVGVTDENGSHEGSVGEYFQQGPALDAEVNNTIDALNKRFANLKQDNDYSDTDSALGVCSICTKRTLSIRQANSDLEHFWQFYNLDQLEHYEVPRREWKVVPLYIITCSIV